LTVGSYATYKFKFTSIIQILPKWMMYIKYAGAESCFS